MCFGEMKKKRELVSRVTSYFPRNKEIKLTLAHGVFSECRVQRTIELGEYKGILVENIAPIVSASDDGSSNRMITQTYS